MPSYATLLKPNSFTTMGITFQRGDRKEVSYTTARALYESGRFKVELDDREATMKELTDERAGKPYDKVKRLQAIRDAIDELDPDDETNFRPDGSPDARALSAALGWMVTGEERDQALSAALRPGVRELVENAVDPRLAERGDMSRTDIVHPKKRPKKKKLFGPRPPKAVAPTEEKTTTAGIQVTGALKHLPKNIRVKHAPSKRADPEDPTTENAVEV
jgi:hypothetical protein